MVLHCNGKLDEMREVAARRPELSGMALDRADRRWRRATARSRSTDEAARAELDALVASGREQQSA